MLQGLQGPYGLAFSSPWHGNQNIATLNGMDNKKFGRPLIFGNLVSMWRYYVVLDTIVNKHLKNGGCSCTDVYASLCHIPLSEVHESYGISPMFEAGYSAVDLRDIGVAAAMMHEAQTPLSFGYNVRILY